jgi:hypothetical protein
LGVFAVIWSFAHYAAPFTCVIVALLVQSIRHLRAMNVATWELGRWLSRAAILLLLIETISYPARHQCDPLVWTCQGDPSRAAIQTRLSLEPGKHLIIVRYEPDHNIHDEWVYNGANIDAAKVLWARELDAPQNAKLLAYFKDRTAWLVEPDVDNTELIPLLPARIVRRELAEQPPSTARSMTCALYFPHRHYHDHGRENTGRHNCLISPMPRPMQKFVWPDLPCL